MRLLLTKQKQKVMSKRSEGAKDGDLSNKIKNFTKEGVEFLINHILAEKMRLIFEKKNDG